MPVKTTIRPAPSEPKRSAPVLEPQGERRRRQLIEIAARLIGDEGVEAASIPRVAELAGVGRTAIYRYFQRREDLMAAVEEDFYAHLRERISEADFAKGFLALGEPAPESPPPETLRLFEAIWATLIDRGPAGLILRAQAPLHDAEEGDSASSARFAGPLISMGLNPLEAALVGDSANAILTRLYFRARRGEIDRGEALRIGYRALASLVHGLRTR